MRATSGGAASGKGFGGDVFGSMFDMELGKVMASRGLGLQEMLLRGIERGKPTGTEAEAKVPKRGETANAPEPSGDLQGLPPETRANASPPPTVQNVPFAPFQLGTGPNASPAPSVENVPASPSPPDSGFPIRDGGRVSSGFGFRKDPFTGGIAFHRGMDIAAAAGTPIYPVRGEKSRSAVTRRGTATSSSSTTETVSSRNTGTPGPTSSTREPWSVRTRSSPRWGTRGARPVPTSTSRSRTRGKMFARKRFWPESLK